jgi:cytochrome c553
MAAAGIIPRRCASPEFVHEVAAPVRPGRRRDHDHRPGPTAAAVTPLPPPGPATAGDAKAGQTKAGACAACHGLDGNSADAQYPKLAGQHERYIQRMLTQFQKGGRENPIMMGMAGSLSPQDMRDVGAYFATQHALPGVADDTKIAEGPYQGQKFYQVGENLFRAGKPASGVPACAACHGPTGRGNPGPAYPSLAGQHAAYTTLKLKFFRDGGVWGKDKDANNVMSGVAHGLTDQEIDSLASYIEGLHPSDQ